MNSEKFAIPTDDQLDKFFIAEAKKFEKLSTLQQLEFLGIPSDSDGLIKNLKRLKQFKHHIKQKELQASNRLFNMRRNRSSMVC